MAIRELIVRYGLDFKGVDAGLQRMNANIDKTNKDIEHKYGALRSKLDSIGTSMTMAVSLPLAAAGAGMLKLSMNAVESENLFDVSMGRMAKNAREWSNQLSASLGLNSYAIRNSLGTWQSMLTAMGSTEQASLSMGKGLTALAYDLASFKNIGFEEAFLKLSSAMTGEVEPMKRLGYIINEEQTKTYAYANGIANMGAKLTETQKVMARYGLIMQVTSLAQGDLARTIDSPLNQLKRLQTQTEEVAIKFGNLLIPSFKKAVTEANAVAKSLMGMTDAQRKTTLGIAGMAIVIGPAIGLVSKLGLAIRSAAIFAAANPIVVGVTVVATGLGILAKLGLDASFRDIDSTMADVRASNDARGVAAASSKDVAKHGYTPTGATKAAQLQEIARKRAELRAASGNRSEYGEGVDEPFSEKKYRLERKAGRKLTDAEVMAGKSLPTSASPNADWMKADAKLEAMQKHIAKYGIASPKSSTKFASPAKGKAAGRRGRAGGGGKIGSAGTSAVDADTSAMDAFFATQKLASDSKVEREAMRLEDAGDVVGAATLRATHTMNREKQASQQAGTYSAAHGALLAAQRDRTIADARASVRPATDTLKSDEIKAQYEISARSKDSTDPIGAAHIREYAKMQELLKPLRELEKAGKDVSSQIKLVYSDYNRAMEEIVAADKKMRDDEAAAEKERVDTKRRGVLDRVTAMREEADQQNRTFAEMLERERSYNLGRTNLVSSASLWESASQTGAQMRWSAPIPQPLPINRGQEPEQWEVLTAQQSLTDETKRLADVMEMVGKYLDKPEGRF